VDVRDARGPATGPQPPATDPQPPAAPPCPRPVAGPARKAVTGYPTTRPTAGR